jgi:hypothetical protein
MPTEDKDRHSIVIKSAHGGTTLDFSELAGGFYRVTLSVSDVRGSCLVCDYEPAAYLRGFFRDLATNWRGWKGKKEWSSLEGELRLTATSDSVGHISLSVRIRSGPYPFDWSLSTTLLLEAGNLEQIASQVDGFMAA